MMNIDKYEKNQILSESENIIKKYKNSIIRVGKYIHHNPETGFNEYKACIAITKFLDSIGYYSKRNFCGIKTAFKSGIKSGKKENGAVAVIAEYDALPGLGHGCGHNLITVSAITTALLMGKLKDAWAGEFYVIGTPAEELYAGKAIMLEKGAFNGLKACFMAHPSSSSMKTVPSNALETINILFKGRSAHAAVNPDDGINALDAAILFYTSLNSMRQHIREDARLHAIITDGGKAVNVIPEKAEVKVVVRSNDEKYLVSLRKKVCNAAISSAGAIGAEVLIRHEGPAYRAFKLSTELDDLLAKSFQMVGIHLKDPQIKESRGSLDMGNVSRVVPSAHPFFSIIPPHKRVIALHTRQFLKQADSNYAYNQAIKAGIAMAFAAVQLQKIK